MPAVGRHREAVRKVTLRELRDDVNAALFQAAQPTSGGLGPQQATLRVEPDPVREHWLELEDELHAGFREREDE